MRERLLAQGLTNPTLQNILGGKGGQPGSVVVGKLISSLIGAMFVFGFIFAFGYLLLGGIQWITSGGDKAALESARNRIMNALVGLLIVGAAWAIFNLVGQFFGLEIQALPIPTIK